MSENYTYINCTKCGCKIRSTDNYCVNCGACQNLPPKPLPMPAPEPKPLMFPDEPIMYSHCPKCGYRVGATDEFCKNCGVNIILFEEEERQREEKRKPKRFGMFFPNV